MVVAAALGAQEIPSGWRPSNPFPKEEAPAALFQLESGDAEVELYLLGSWSAQSRVATGIAFHPALPDGGRRVTFPYQYPGFETELFAQTVDLTLSLWLYRNYFFEASFSDQSDVNTLAAGYIGDDEEVVQEVVVGNVPLTVERYPYQYTGSPGARTGGGSLPGAVMRLETARTYHELLVQLESSQARRLRVASDGILTEKRIPAPRYLREARYVLPDREITAFTAYVQDPDGDVVSLNGRSRYRQLDETRGEYTVDRTAGTLRIASEIRESDRPVAVYYETADGTPVGDPDAGRGALVPLDASTLNPTSGPLVDFEFGSDSLLERLTGGSGAGGLGPAAGPALNDFELRLADGRSALLLRQSGVWSPFESANLYSLPEDLPLPEEDSLRIQLVNPGTRTPIDEEREFRARRLGSTGLVEIVAADFDERNDGVRDISWRYPFAERNPREAHAGIYGPRAVDGGAPVELLVSYRTDQEEVSLDGNVVPGTVNVTVDGRPLEGVEFDPGSGSLTLPDSISPTAVVDVSYREYTAGGTSDLVALSGNRWQATPELSLALAAGVRWTFTDESYSTELDQHPGQATLSTTTGYRGESLTVNAAAAVQLSQSDTTGVMRLAGASGRSTSIPPDAETTFPASAPDPAGGALNRELRAEAAYRDHWSVDALGNVSLLPYERTPAADEPRSGSRIGPYLAASTDSAYSGPVAVLEWDALAPENSPGSWIGAQIRLAGGESDLSSARSVTIRYRLLPPVDALDESLPPGGGDPRLRLDLGALAEDLDGDGVLDEGRSAVDPLLEFDAPQGLRRAGQDAPRLARAHSEDGNDNGILDGEAPGGVFFHSESLSATTGWRTLKVDLDGSERAQLTATRAVRLILRNAGAEAFEGGRLLIGAVEVTRTTEAVVVSRGGGSATVSVTEDPLAGGGDELRRRFSVVGDRLAADADSQRVYALEWSDADAAATDNGTEEVTFQTDINEFSTDRYDTLSLFLYLDDSDSPVSGALDASGTPEDSVEVRLAPYGNAPDDERITVTLPAAELTGGWHQVDISLTDGTVRIDGSPTDLPAEIPEAGDFLRTVQVATRGLSAGTLYMDELHATDPRAGFAAAGNVDAVWQQTLAEGRLAGTRITVEQRVTAQGEDFRAGAAASSATNRTGTPVGRSLRSTTLLRGERQLLLTEVQTTLETDGIRESGAWGHRLYAPLLPGGAVRLQERFYRDYAPRSSIAEREVALISSGDWGTWRLSTANRADQREIVQEWGFSGAPPGIGRVSSSFTSDLSVRSLDQRVAAAPYGTAWLASGARMIPLSQNDGRQERAADTGFTVEIGNFELKPAAGWTNRSSLSGDQTDRLEVFTTWPVQFREAGVRPWEIRPEYHRRWTLQRRSKSTSLAEDFTHWSRSVARDTGAVTAIPLAELLQPASQLGYTALTGDELARTYDAEARIRFGRTFGSRPRDLYVPSEITAALARNRHWESDSRADQRVWELGVTATAINLYGTQGSRPRVSWYRSDEFENRVTLQLNEPVGSTPSWRITVAQTSRIFGFAETEGELATTVQIDGPDPRGMTAASGAIFRWRTLRYPDLALFERLQEEPYYQHEEELTVEAEFQDGSYRGSEVIARHRTALVLGANGSISAYGDLGWLTDPARYDEGTLQAVGLQLGLEGRLEY